MRLYKCQVKCSGAGLDVYLNEYHLYSNPGASHSYSTNMAAWMEKENLFRLAAGPAVRPGAGGAFQLSFQAVVIQNGQSSILASVELPEAALPPAFTNLPFDSSGVRLAPGNNLDFACPEPADIVLKPWNQTSRIIDDPREIYKLYAEIQANVVGGNFQRLMELATERVTFVAQLTGSARATFEQKVRRDFASAVSGGAQWKTVQDPEKELTIHEFLPGKVIRVLDQNRNPPLRTVADKDGIQFGYEVILAMTPQGLRWIM